MSYQCPVCGYGEMKRPPADFYICPCCGVEFGNDDYEFDHAQLRQQWADRGYAWFSSYTPQPPDWSAYTQLASLGEVRSAPSASMPVHSFAKASPAAADYDAWAGYVG